MSQPKLVAEIREAFLKYFERNGHTRVSSSSLVPANDPTLLFTNAGMVQFKDCFLGNDVRPYKRATSVQKCVRAGGKHNDLENVGFTARHHTFFEMLGNFSFGDYFKKDAIHFAWEFVTKDLGLPKDRLRVSVFEKDDEGADIWHKQEGLPRDRIMRFGEKDNFWAMGDTGPCGPCSEIFWDQGREVDGDRWLEFWNCVFMEFDRDASGKLKKLPKPSVDTGMGLERIAAIMQGVPSNYDIDSMRFLVEATARLASQRSRQNYDLKKIAGSWQESALRVIVDHLRATSFLIADGVLPSNEGRGYVLRRILRRAVRFGKRLGMNDPFLADLYPELQKSMAAVYPELNSRASVVKEILSQEESKFFETLDRGLHLLDDAFAKSSNKKLDPETVFRLYDTFGFPVDLTALIARENQFSVDESAVTKLMEAAQERSRASWKGSGAAAISEEVKEWKSKGIFPKWTAYESDEALGAKIVALAASGPRAWVAVDPCPFYAEGGGQVGDRGVLKAGGKTYRILDCMKPYEGGYALLVDTAASNLKVGDQVDALVDRTKRAAVRANHTATHLMHAALRKVLGTHVQQAGSLVTEDKLRFDFSHHKSLNPSEIAQVENWVNDAIANDVPLDIAQCSYKDAIEKKGALAFFEEKYGDKVRVVSVPGFSTELCGGLHARSTGQIRFFKIVGESAVAAGTRRIEAITGEGFLKHAQENENLLSKIGEKLKSAPAQLEERVEKIVANQKALEEEIKALQKKMLSGADSGATVQEAKFKNHAVNIHSLPQDQAALLKDKADVLREKAADRVHVILAGKSVVVTLDEKKLSGLHAGDILKSLTSALGGRGGGQARTAQGQFQSEINSAEIAQWFGNQK
jgi:alanyl-tRNA synthetase